MVLEDDEGAGAGVPRQRTVCANEGPETEVGNLYSKLKHDVSFRRQWAERIGLRFDLRSSSWVPSVAS